MIFCLRCECPEGFDGPQCEVMGVGFNGNGWALYPPLGACSDSHISVELQPREKNGLILYGGPFNHHRSSASAQGIILFLKQKLTFPSF